MSFESTQLETPQNAALSSFLIRIIRRIISSAIILLMIAFLTFSGLYLADQGHRGQPVEFLSALKTILGHLIAFLFDHPSTYVWHKEVIPALTLVLDLFRCSVGLLGVSLAIATLFGMLGGIQAALSRRNVSSPWMVIVSILGVSTPSFLLAMLLWVINLAASRVGAFHFTALPPHGFGWDRHLILPALVLAARPFAQIMQVTYINMSEILDQDFIRSVKAKGASQRYLIIFHALRNILIPVFTTLTTSLRFSLSSLPVVESFFLWPGIGLAILQAISLDMPTLVTDLTISLGLMFLMLNILLDIVYPIIDPRLRSAQQAHEAESSPTFSDRVNRVIESFQAYVSDLLVFCTRFKPQVTRKNDDRSGLSLLRPGKIQDDAHLPQNERRRIFKAAITNAPLVLGTLIVIGLVGLVIWGSGLSAINPYTTRNVMMIEGKVYSPPFPPSTIFPWGSDSLGRDIQSLVFAGARQTLVLAFLAVIARLAVGIILGMIAGWWQGSWLDRLIQGLIAVWAAFPVTIFTAIVILGLGIQRGIGIFVVALCLTGWSEITQYIRGQVIAQKPSLYIEAARSVGAHSPWILFKHILPQMIPGILVLAMLEMGGILMLLAELGFLEIFLGGGFRVEMVDGKISAFSDVPEWGALLSNIRSLWRSYPWVAWSPGLAFFISILGFNLLGEGLRRFLAESRINLSRLINRYSVLALGLLVFGVYTLVQTSAPVEFYRPQAKLFDSARAINDIAVLSSPEMMGRESGTQGQRMSAAYIAQRMDEIGLLPAGSSETFIQELSNTSYHLTAVPSFEILDDFDRPVEALVYRQDYVEGSLVPIPGYAQGSGTVLGLAVGNGPAETKRASKDLNIRNNVVILREEDLQYLPRLITAGMLVISDDPTFVNRRYLSPFSDNPVFPVLMITPQLADRLLNTAGSSLTALDEMRNKVQANQLATTRSGVKVSIWFPFDGIDLSETCQNVIGHIPGSGAQMGERMGAGLDNQVILLSAYYDGLGVGPDGTLYPGANDNASGVAALLEVARVLKTGPYQPKKTVLFVAWCGGERQDGLSLVNIMNAKTGFSRLEMEAVLELSGLAQGSGHGIAIGSGTSYRLVQLIEKAAGRINLSVTTRGRDVHIDIPRQSGFGGRKALTAFLSWDGSDYLAHTPEDRIEYIDIAKMQKSGELASLVTTILSRETDY